MPAVGLFDSDCKFGTPACVAGGFSVDSNPDGCLQQVCFACFLTGTRVIGAWRRLKPAFFIYSGFEALKPTSEKAGIGLRRENIGFPESKTLKP